MNDQFKAWQATRALCSDLPGELQIDADCVNRTGYVYDGGYIEIRDVPDARGRFYLLIERSDWISDSLEELEELLWANWAAHESDVPVTMLSGNDLDVFVRGICRAHGYAINGDVFGVVFSGRDEWSPDEAERTVHDAAKIYDLRVKAAEFFA